MKKKTLLLPLLLLSSSGAFILANQNEIKPTFAWHFAPTGKSLSSKQTIDLNDNSEEEIRYYYSSLNSLSEDERKGDNILKNLKPILQQFDFYSYDNVWKIYEITDREWELSPASETQFGTYDSANNKILNYEYGSNSNPKNDPYVHTLYRNRDENGVTIESGRIKEWGSHTQTGGTNREHVWCQSRGFKADSGANGPSGTDLHHLISGDGYVNGKPHNNNPYGYVDPNNITIDSKNSYAYCEGNIAGKPLHPHSEDQSTIFFEPQDSDKGDIARACFYMVACYNNISGNETITQFNPNLTLVDYASSSGEREDSSATHAVGMGILSDLLEWHKLDPVDEYEIHRNNLIYNNYQHNRNPFIDFPEWVDYIWGDEKGNKAINPASDKIGELDTDFTISAKNHSFKVGETFEISAKSIGDKPITWTISDSSVVSLSKTSSNSEEKITVTALKVGSATIEATTTIDSEIRKVSCKITVQEGKKAIPVYYYVIAGIALLLFIGLLIMFPKLRKKTSRRAKSQVKKQINNRNKSSSKKK